MNSYREHANGIRFGDILFSEPEALSGSTRPVGLIYRSPGLYVILAFDATYRPWPYRALYFGESENIRSRATTSHENYESWRREGGDLLYLAFHEMPGSQQNKRQAIESGLITQYNPPCNQRLSLNISKLFGL